MAKVKDLSLKEDVFCAGHRACAGCAPATTMRQVTLAVDTNLVAGLSTGCMEVVSTIYPFTAWRCSFIHNAFENVAATISGVEAAYRVLKRKGKLDAEYSFLAMGGDGGTYDIGLQSLSGAMERGHRMLYLCYDNQGYMNTGIQRSSSTPYGAATSTTPAGLKIPGKQNFQKNLTEIMVGHEIPYVAQANIGYHRDLLKKVEKALSIDGPTFICVLSSCHRGWRIRPEDSLRALELPPRLAHQARRLVEILQARRRYVPVAAVRGRRRQIQALAQAQRKAADRRMAQGTGPLRPHAQARKRRHGQELPAIRRQQMGAPPRPLRRRLASTKHTKKS